MLASIAVRAGVTAHTFFVARKSPLLGKREEPWSCRLPTESASRESARAPQQDSA